MFDIYYKIGELLVIDDIKDLGAYSFEGHPSPIHHWQWGVLLMLGASIGEMISMLTDTIGNLQKEEYQEDNVEGVEEYGE